MKKLVSIFLALAMILSFAACAKEDTQGSEDGNEEVEEAQEELFIWTDNKISGLTEAGMEKEKIVIPANCEGFYGGVFTDSNVKELSFESDNDIELDIAFKFAESLEKVKLPKNLTVIPEATFMFCSNLKEINIPEAVTSIGDSAFQKCESLKKVVFEGTSITEIPRNCFVDCTSLTTISIPEGVVSLKTKAFDNCRALTNVEIPTTLKNFGESTFVNTAIKELHFPAELQIETIDASVFAQNAISMKIYVKAGSWCDTNRTSWDIGFGEIVAE